MFKKLSAKSIIALGVSGLAVAMFAGSVALSASSANVTATVTVQSISLSVSDGSVAYGTLAADTAADTCSSHLDQAQTVTNDGNILEDFNIKGVNTTDWTLGATAGTDQYIHSFANGACTTSFTGTALTTSDQTFATDIAALGTATLNLQIHTPNPSTSFDEQSPNVTLTAVAAS